MRLTLFTALMLAAVPALAAPLDARPAFTGKAVEAQPVTEPAAKTPAADGYNDLAPTEEDMRRARAERRHQYSSQPEPYISPRGTKIEELHDQNNRLTEVRVTPGTTEIPYTMKNRSDRPIDNRPGADPRSTLDTPKFIQFGW